ncbi:MAG: hypothetical protein CV087_18885 [Candidatus Brocadia sp. WS118]|nr:MAG: hypothetical protein CV087_18885 [Candidatus Brocadia sp. WS118]
MNDRNHPLITIGISTYNRAGSYLTQALESALNQTYRNLEIIVSDNCSTDNTEAVVTNYQDPRIQYIKQEKNIGANNNFNFCLRKAKGAYFLLLHDDDLIDSDFIETCMEAAHFDTNFGIIRTGTRIIDSHGKVLKESPNRVVGLSTEEFFRGWFAGKTSLYVCSTLFNTRRLKEIGGFKSKHNLFQDVIAEVKLASGYGRIDVQNIKASFRTHASEMTYAVKTRDWCEDSFELLDLICELSPKKKALIKSEGMIYFSTVNYYMAMHVKSPFRRFIAYLIVFKKFRCKYFPPLSHYPFYKIYYGMRFLKRMVNKRSFFLH